MALRKSLVPVVLAALLATTGMVFMPTRAHAVPSQADLEAAQARVDELGSQLIAFQSELDEAEADLVRTDNDIEKTQGQIEDTQAELAAARALLGRHMRSGYKTGPVNFLEVLFSSTSLEDFANRIYYMDKVNEQDAATIDRINELERQLQQQMGELEAQKATQEQRVAEVEERVGEFEALVAEAQDYYSQLDAEIQAELARQAEEEATRQSAAAAVIEAAGGSASGGGSSDGGSSGGNSDAGNTASSTDAGNSEVTNNPDTDSSGPYPGAGVASAYSCLGWPYVWGGYNTATGGFDCSGLVSYCYGDGTWRRGAEPLGLAIINAGLWKTSLDQLVPGDLVFTRSEFNHVGIYIGGGMMIHAPRPGTVVCVSEVYAFYGGGPFVRPF